MQELGFYTFGNREYYETPSRIAIGSQHADVLRELLPEDWCMERFDVWLGAAPPAATMPVQGFKVHVSCAGGESVDMLRRIVPVCTAQGVAFKVVADPSLHRFMISKRYHRGGSGKFAAIYPASEQILLSVLADLHAATEGMDGPYILSDNRYRDSKVVFYRYGGFQRMPRLNVDGTRSLMLRTPTGEEVVDERTPYFTLPTWVADPVTAALSSNDDAEGPGELLNGRYQVLEALAFTNTGGVYRALDTLRGVDIVIKEARPHTLPLPGAEPIVDAVSALRHEHACLERLRGVPCIPEVVELFQEWEHTFLVVGFCAGTPVAKLRARSDFMLMNKMHVPALVDSFCRKWRLLGWRLLEALDMVHARGIIVGDISPGNVLVDPESGAIGIIDLEGAWFADASTDVAKFSTHWHNPGFRKRTTRAAGALSREDDYYACGMLMYNLVCPAQSLFELDREHPIFRFLDHFIQAGLPTEARSVIEALLAGDAAGARQVLIAWEPGLACRALVAEAMVAADADDAFETLRVSDVERIDYTVEEQTRADERMGVTGA